MSNILAKYNIPVPRYTSYPPANYFSETFTAADYEKALTASNHNKPSHISFYIHIPFCRHLCNYCGCNSFAMTGKEKIKQYLNAVNNEISYVTSFLDPERKITQIHYGGGTPTIIPAQELAKINSRLLSSFQQIEKPEIAIECHPAYLSISDWRELLNAGFNRFSIGVQDFNEKVLKAVNRRPPNMPLQTILSLLKKQNAGVNLDLLYGLPLQTVNSFAQTVRQAADLNPDRIVTFSYAHVPWINNRQLMLEKIGLPAEKDKTDMYRITGEILSAAGYKPVGLDHFVKTTDELYQALKNKQLHRNFQGYCTRRTTGQVYAFGVSAISQLSCAYAQNSKDINQYILKTNTGAATVKGYSLSKEEQVTRTVIETLMCNLCIDFDELSNATGLPAETIKTTVNFNTERFAEFANDEIITLTENSIEITPKGRLFVRNVAATFDKLQTTTNRKFSKPV
ncbi:MAG: oxygen-independent coproporphyrinogen III oxidase [Dysgonamonadaceae bacterium]|jgi:oxygen-independent coproporphyrinogen-3 oxidase|nr:oxygen-independent coproporphyrinogen III oxidase [Dysgonamonadaceae bacterium]